MSKNKLLLLFLVDFITLVVVYLLVYPVPISPVAWNPPPAPALAGQYQQNSQLARVERLSLGTGTPRPGAGFAPEDVAIDADNLIYAGLDDGRIMRLQPDGTHPAEFSNTHGRPLGLAFDGNGNLIVADANEGLLSIARDGSVTVLTTEADGLRFVCTNDLDIAKDGTIYFTDASSKFPLSNFTADILEHGPNGRLLAYDPKTKTTRTLMKDLCFANGVAVSPDQTFLLAVETGAYRVHRYWLSGPKQGQSEIFIDNLPGFPDGISSNGKDKFWLALVTPRDQTLDKLLPHPFLRKIVYRLPRFLQPAPKRYSFVLGLDRNGKVVENLQNPAPDCYAEIANAVEHNGALYFGSIGESTIGRFASISIVATAVFSSEKQQPSDNHPRKHPKEWLTSIPAVDSKVKDLEIINARIVRAETDAPGVAFEVRNNSNLAVMAVEVTCGEAGISQDGLADEEHPTVIIEPHGTLKAEMDDELSPGMPIVITAAAFEDGSEKGRETSVELMLKLRARDRARPKAEKERQQEQEKPHKWRNDKVIRNRRT